MATSINKFPPLSFTSNNLGDIIRFINEKNVVALHTESACRVFHSIAFKKPEDAESLKDVRVIYVDCNSYQNLLANGEWEWFIKDAVKDVHELGIDSMLRKAIIEQKTIPNRTYISLGY